MLTFKLQGINDAGKATAFVAGTVLPKNFKTGSDGYFTNTKSAVPTTAKTVMFELRDDDTVLAAMVVPAKEFKTGSVGYFTSEKCALDGGLYQMQVQLVLIGSRTQMAETKSLPNNYQVQIQLVRIGSKPTVVAAADATTGTTDAATA